MPRRREPITLQEAAERLGVHYMTAYRYIRTGRLPAERNGVQWMVDPGDLETMRAPGRAPRGSGGGRAESPARLAARMVAGDEAGAWALIEAVLASGAEPADVYLDILVPALEQVGEGWAAAELSVADEHRAATLAQRLIGRLGPSFARRGRKRGTIVIGEPAGEQHGLASAIVSDLLRGAGFTVVDLGANTPPASFVDSCRGVDRLAAVMIGATMAGRDATLRATVRALRNGGIAAPVLVGGAAMEGDDHAVRLGADHWSGRDGRSAVAAVEAAIAEDKAGR